MRVLLVEDDELLGDGICSGLKHFGHTIDWVKDGRAAYKALTSNIDSFDVIVLDIGLPKLNGLEVLKCIRDENIATPVVILTAREAIDDRVKGLDMGADDYLTKPFDLQKLLENSGRVISREQLNQTLYGWGENIDSNALEVHIHNLRKRFGTSLIRTIRGVGYMAEKQSES